MPGLEIKTTINSLEELFAYISSKCNSDENQSVLTDERDRIRIYITDKYSFEISPLEIIEFIMAKGSLETRNIFNEALNSGDITLDHINIAIKYIGTIRRKNHSKELTLEMLKNVTLRYLEWTKFAPLKQKYQKTYTAANDRSKTNDLTDTKVRDLIVCLMKKTFGADTGIYSFLYLYFGFDGRGRKSAKESIKGIKNQRDIKQIFQIKMRINELIKNVGTVTDNKQEIEKMVEVLRYYRDYEPKPTILSEININSKKFKECIYPQLSAPEKDLIRRRRMQDYVELIHRFDRDDIRIKYFSFEILSDRDNEALTRRIEKWRELYGSKSSKKARKDNSSIGVTTVKNTPSPRLVDTFNCESEEEFRRTIVSLLPLSAIKTISIQFFDDYQRIILPYLTCERQESLNSIEAMPDYEFEILVEFINSVKGIITKEFIRGIYSSLTIEEMRVLSYYFNDIFSEEILPVLSPFVQEYFKKSYCEKRNDIQQLIIRLQSLYNSKLKVNRNTGKLLMDINLEDIEYVDPKLYLENIISRLDLKTFEILSYYLGLFDIDHTKLPEIAQKYSLSKEDVTIYIANFRIMLERKLKTSNLSDEQINSIMECTKKKHRSISTERTRHASRVNNSCSEIREPKRQTPIFEYYDNPPEHIQSGLDSLIDSFNELSLREKTILKIYYGVITFGKTKYQKIELLTNIFQPAGGEDTMKEELISVSDKFKNLCLEKKKQPTHFLKACGTK